MGAAIRLVVPIPFVILVLLSTATTLILEIFTTYKVYARYLKWLSALAFLYLITVFIVHEPWSVIARATFVPQIELSFAFFFIIMGNIGTTIAPYLFFWETSEEVEEDKEHHRIHRDGLVSISKNVIRKIQFDNAFGMFISQVITWSIIVVSATVLHSAGVTNLNSAADAAKALEPLVQTFPHAGFLAKALFAIGIVSAGLLVVPVLSGSAAYALAETVNWKEGLNLKLKKAHGFYGVITVATIIGLSINFIGINPIRLLIYTSVLNGVVSIPLIFLIAKIGSNQKIMGENTSGKLSIILTWIAFIAMTGALLGAIVTF
jgi:Mn2+/Fe2+ NRAMP family transporter